MAHMNRQWGQKKQMAPNTQYIKQSSTKQISLNNFKKSNKAYHFAPTKLGDY